MTENKYQQLKKRVEWLDAILIYCDSGRVVSHFGDSVKAAKHFRDEMISKISRYEVAHGSN